ncbi:hypothetical protein KR093_003534 [Drosophila rubida]|uniref:HMG box domain-containing protein n=1 Tax=Drosophila rubida TaxID=30044 RepID=A0AAD4JWG1_9MUSC|nr:hypothetical protein KR093_003534 [Drosophila rubida]
MNQFHTPSFGDEVFEMNDTPMEQTPTPNPNASRRISRLSSLDHVDDADEEQMDFEVTPQHQEQPQLLPPQQQQTAAQASQSNQAPAKPLAPFALFFRDTMTAIKQQNPACTLEQITSIVHSMWDSMDTDQKTVYERRHEVDKRDYMIKLRDYQRQLQTTQLDTPSTAASEQEQQQPQQETSTTTQADTVAAVAVSEDVAPSAGAVPATPLAAVAPQQPEQIQLLNEAAAVPKCTRELCNKPAIINPDWEDEYCSNECVVIHCRNVFNEWARALQFSPP